MRKEAAWDEWQGDFMGFFRHPVSRDWSSYRYFGGGGYNESEYMQRIEGTQARMLAGQRCASAGERTRTLCALPCRC